MNNIPVTEMYQAATVGAADLQISLPANVTGITNSTVALFPTAASVSISGRVLTADGRAVSNAQLLLSGANGESRSARTNSFGYFRFPLVAAGETFVLTAKHKHYQFAPLVFNVSDDITELTLTNMPEE